MKRILLTSSLLLGFVAVGMAQQDKPRAQKPVSAKVAQLQAARAAAKTTAPQVSAKAAAENASAPANSTTIERAPQAKKN